MHQQNYDRNHSDIQNCWNASKNWPANDDWEIFDLAYLHRSHIFSWCLPWTGCIHWAFDNVSRSSDINKINQYKYHVKVAVRANWMPANLDIELIYSTAFHFTRGTGWVVWLRASGVGNQIVGQFYSFTRHHGIWKYEKPVIVMIAPGSSFRQIVK